MGRHSRMKKRRAIKAVAVFSVLAFVVLVAFIGYTYYESKHAVVERSVETPGFGRYEERIFDGKTYYKKTNITTFLILGVDRDTTMPMYGYRDGGSADFQMLLVLDHDKKEIHTFQIDRDTMTSFILLNASGKAAVGRPMQICLAHNYGATQIDCAKNSIDAIYRVLPGMTIDLYMAFDYNTVPLINDYLGGVTVTLDDDFTSVDPEMVQGKTITLHGEQAEHFVRSRMTIGDGTNVARQSRQRVWLDGAIKLLEERTKEDNNFVGKLFESLGYRLTTNISEGRLINEFNQAYNYTRVPVEEMEGTHYTGDDGHMEFHPDQSSITNWIRDTYYRPAEQ